MKVQRYFMGFVSLFAKYLELSFVVCFTFLQTIATTVVVAQSEAYDPNITFIDEHTSESSFRILADASTLVGENTYGESFTLAKHPDGYFTGDHLPIFPIPSGFLVRLTATSETGIVRRTEFFRYLEEIPTLEPVTEPEMLSCSEELSHGESTSREGFTSQLVSQGDTCERVVQNGVCENGTILWDQGSFSEECNVYNPKIFFISSTENEFEISAEAQILTGENQFGETFPLSKKENGYFVGEPYMFPIPEGFMVRLIAQNSTGQVASTDFFPYLIEEPTVRISCNGGEMEHGETTSRESFLHEYVPFGEECVAFQQSGVCSSGEIKWSGDWNPSCEQILPKIYIVNPDPTSFHIETENIDHSQVQNIDWEIFDPYSDTVMQTFYGYESILASNVQIYAGQGLYLRAKVLIRDTYLYSENSIDIYETETVNQYERTDTMDVGTQLLGYPIYRTLIFTYDETKPKGCWTKSSWTLKYGYREEEFCDFTTDPIGFTNEQINELRRAMNSVFRTLARRHGTKQETRTKYTVLKCTLERVNPDYIELVTRDGLTLYPENASNAEKIAALAKVFEYQLDEFLGFSNPKPLRIHIRPILESKVLTARGSAFPGEIQYENGYAIKKYGSQNTPDNRLEIRINPAIIPTSMDNASVESNTLTRDRNGDGEIKDVDSNNNGQIDDDEREVSVFNASPKQLLKTIIHEIAHTFGQSHNHALPTIELDPAYRMGECGEDYMFFLYDWDPMNPF